MVESQRDNGRSLARGALILVALDDLIQALADGMHRNVTIHVPGEGLEPSRPARGHPILSRARITSFATPARSEYPGSPRYWPGANL